MRRSARAAEIDWKGDVAGGLVDKNAVADECRINLKSTPWSCNGMRRREGHKRCDDGIEGIRECKRVAKRGEAEQLFVQEVRSQGSVKGGYCRLGVELGDFPGLRGPENSPSSDYPLHQALQ